MSVIAQYTGLTNDEFSKSVREYQNLVENAKEVMIHELKGVKNLEVVNITYYKVAGYHLGNNGFVLTDGKQEYSIIDAPQLTLRGYKKELFNFVKSNGVFIKGLFDSITIRN